VTAVGVAATAIGGAVGTVTAAGGVTGIRGAARVAISRVAISRVAISRVAISRVATSPPVTGARGAGRVAPWCPSRTISSEGSEPHFSRLRAEGGSLSGPPARWGGGRQGFLASTSLSRGVPLTIEHVFD